MQISKVPAVKLSGIRAAATLVLPGWSRRFGTRCCVWSHCERTTPGGQHEYSTGGNTQRGLGLLLTQELVIKLKNNTLRFREYLSRRGGRKTNLSDATVWCNRTRARRPHAEEVLRHVGQEVTPHGATRWFDPFGYAAAFILSYPSLSGDSRSHPPEPHTEL